jgi:flagellar FliL protein
MAKDKETEEGAKPGKAKKGKGNLIPAVVVAVGLVGGAYMMKGGGGAKKGAAGTTVAAGSPVTTSTTDPMLAPATAKTLAQVAKLDDITLNLSDGHFLKVGLALQLAPKAVVTDYTTGGAAAKALDLAIGVFGADNYAQLVQPAIREQAKADLARKVVAAYNGQVQGIYITDFVMQ